MRERTNKRVLNSVKKRLKQSIPNGMHLKIYDFNFSNERPDYFTMELTTQVKFEKDLVGGINKELDPFATGLRAKLRDIDYSENEDGRRIYRFEVFPFDEVPWEYKGAATLEYLQSLKPAFDNFWMKYGK